jgi:RHS repeat-associated protein
MHTTPTQATNRKPAQPEICNRQAEALRRVERWLAESEPRGLTYGATGLLEMVEEAGGACSAYTYDRRGDLVRLVEPDGSARTYAYDDERRLITVTHPDGATTRYRYGDNDRLIAIDDRGVRHDFTHDAQGRLTQRRVGNAGASVYHYDDAGRVAEARTSRVLTRYEYDGGGHVTAIHQVIDGVTLTLRLAFDAWGRLAEMRLPGERHPVRYTWDAAGRPDTVALGEALLARYEYGDAEKTARVHLANGCVEETRADPVDSHPLARRVRRDEAVLLSTELTYDAAGRIIEDGTYRYSYDDLGRLTFATTDQACLRFAYDARDHCLPDADVALSYDPLGRQVRKIDGRGAWVYRYDDAGQLREVLRDGASVGQFVYDFKGRLVLATQSGRTERYLYGPADELLAVTDGRGEPLRLVIRTPVGVLAELRGAGALFFPHHDDRGTCHLVTDAQGDVIAHFSYAPFGAPLVDTEEFAPVLRGRGWHAAVGLYYVGARWYDPRLGRFLTPDTFTAAPDDLRLVHPFGPARRQILGRVQILGDWLKRPRARNSYAYCGNDPVNNTDPNGHWSFGGVLLMLLGAIWALPNTLFGLVVEITCLIGEVIRWLVWLISLGHVSWETPGFDVAASGRLNTFALVFRGGWLGSFQDLLGITFGNVFFVYKNWESDAHANPPGNVSPTAYNGTVSFPGSQALYEHELRHTNQYGWLGPFFHLGLPLFGFYEWDVILHGYGNAWTERDAREHGGI